MTISATQIYADRAVARVRTILGNSEARGRTDLADHLAFNTDTSAEASIALLAKAPRGKASASLNQAIDRMNARADIDAESIYARRREEAQARGRAAGYIR
jgi:hypothetical protein